MVGELGIPQQFNGAEFGGEARLVQGPVDDSMLYRGADGEPPLVDALTAQYGDTWGLVTHEPSKMHEQFARILHIPMYDVVVLPESNRLSHQPRRLY